MPSPSCLDLQLQSLKVLARIAPGGGKRLVVHATHQINICEAAQLPRHAGPVHAGRRRPHRCRRAGGDRSRRRDRARRPGELPDRVRAAVPGHVPERRRLGVRPVRLPRLVQRLLQEAQPAAAAGGRPAPVAEPRRPAPRSSSLTTSAPQCSSSRTPGNTVAKISKYTPPGEIALSREVLASAVEIEMGILKCLSACLLVSAVLLLNLPPGLCGCYKRVFSFGDSIIDTGNFVHMSGNGSSRYKELPYGMTFFKNATGRICDGRVLVDFYAQAFQLPMIPPNLPEQDSGRFPNGANFAVAGATAMPPAYYRRWNHSVPMPHSLGVQIGWFKQMLRRLAPGDDDGAKIRQLLNESLIVLGEIGGNDYNFWFWFGDAAKPREQANQFIPDIVARIGSSVQELIGLGVLR